MKALTRMTLGSGVLLAAVSHAPAQQTVGLFKRSASAYPGYTLVSTIQSKHTYLLDLDGRPVHQWTSTFTAGIGAYLDIDGSLVRAAAIGALQNPVWIGNVGGGGRIERFDWDGNLTWSMDINDAQNLQHHDLEILPNGNILATVWEFIPAATAIAAGRDPANLADGDLYSEAIVEIHPTPPSGGQIVWKWRVWDHLVQDFDSTKANFGVVASNPQRIDINPNGADPFEDWLHINSVKYNASLDQIAVSVHRFSEFWVIDHSTTTAEAATESGGIRGNGGALLYRWGNPQKYDRGSPADQILFNQHDAHWIGSGLPGEGHFLVFNNGPTRPVPQPYSEVDELDPPLKPNGTYDLVGSQAYGPPSVYWSYLGTPMTSFYSQIISGSQRMPNANTLICEGVPARLTEVDSAGAIVWRYVSSIAASGPVAQGDTTSAHGNGYVFKVRRYPPDFPGFRGRTLVPGPELETFTPPHPVPEGSLGATRAAVDGSTIDVAWDATSCPSADYNLLFGQLAGLPSYTLSGSRCGLGPAGTYNWTGVPSGDLFFVVVGRDPSGLYESSWGHDGAGQERHGTSSSFQCGVTQKAEFVTCP
jgi:hypothetical protein